MVGVVVYVCPEVTFSFIWHCFIVFIVYWTLCSSDLCNCCHMGRHAVGCDIVRCVWVGVTLVFHTPLISREVYSSGSGYNKTVYIAAEMWSKGRGEYEGRNSKLGGSQESLWKGNLGGFNPGGPPGIQVALPSTATALSMPNVPPSPSLVLPPQGRMSTLPCPFPWKKPSLTSLFSILFTCTCLSGDLSLLLHFAWHASSNTTIPLPELVQYMGVQTCRLLSCHWLHLRSKYTFQPTGALEISINRGCIFVSDRQTDRPILNPICMG